MISKKIIKSKNISNASTDGWLKDHCILIKGYLITNIMPESDLPNDYSLYLYPARYHMIH